MLSIDFIKRKSVRTLFLKKTYGNFYFCSNEITVQVSCNICFPLFLFFSSFFFCIIPSFLRLLGFSFSCGSRAITEPVVATSIVHFTLLQNALKSWEWFSFNGPVDTWCLFHLKHYKEILKAHLFILTLPLSF